MDSPNNLAKPQLIVVAQKGDYIRDKSAEYKAQYKAVVDHLCKFIQESGRVELTTTKVKNRDEFDSTISSLREKQIDPNRPFAFLFIAPEQEGKKANEELENTINEISHVTKGENADPETISSSVIFVNDLDDNQEIKFKDHNNLLKSLASPQGNPSLLQGITKAWQQFTHYSIKNIKPEKLKKQIEDYSKALLEHLAEASNEITPPISKSQVRAIVLKEKSQECKVSKLSIKDLKPEQREKIKAIDWGKAQETSTDAYRKLRYPTMQLVKKGKNYAQVAEALNKKPRTVFKTVNDFLLYTTDFMKGVNLATVTIAKS
jgi:hypothetical protein